MPKIPLSLQPSKTAQNTLNGASNSTNMPQSKLILVKHKYLSLFKNFYVSKDSQLSQPISCAQTYTERAQKENIKPKNNRQTIRSTLFSQCTVENEKTLTKT